MNSSESVAFKYAAVINDASDNSSKSIKYVNKSMTFFDLMETLQEIFERFPFAKHFKVYHNAFDGMTHTSSIEINKELSVIIIS